MKKILNYIIALIWTLLLLVVFIFQGAVDLESKLSSILFFSLPFLWFTYFTLFKIKKNLNIEAAKKKSKEVIVTLSLIIAIGNTSFNLKKVSNAPILSFENSSRYLDVAPYKSGRSFKTRLSLSLLEFLKLLPVGDRGDEIINLLVNTIREGELGLFFKSVLKKNNNCINSINGYFKCIESPYDELTSKYQFTTTFDILYTAVAANVIIKNKKHLAGEKGYSKKMSALISTNHLLSFSTMIFKKLELDRKKEKIKFTYGMDLNRKSLLYELLQMINLKFSSNLSKKLKEMVTKVDAKISEKKDLKNNEKDQFEAEVKKFKRMKAEIDIMRGEEYFKNQSIKLEELHNAKMKSFKEEGPLQNFFFNLAMKTTNFM